MGTGMKLQVLGKKKRKFWLLVRRFFVAAAAVIIVALSCNSTDRKSVV